MRKVPSPIKHPGFSVVEVVLAGALFLVLATGLVGAYLYGQEATQLAGNRVRAGLLAEEAIEAVRNIRDADFTNLTDGTHGLAVTGNQWVFSGVSDVTGMFTRSVTVSSVDAKRKNVTANVTWQQNPQRTGAVSLATQLTYWMEVIVTTGTWQYPAQAAQLNLTGSRDGLKAQTQGNYLYVLRDQATPDFEVLDISTPDNPFVVGSLSLAGNVRDIYVSGGYAYVTSDSDSAELQIINISTPSNPTLAGTYNDAGGENAQGIFVSGTRAYMTADGGNELVIISISTPAAPTFVGGISLNGFPRDVMVLGNYAYLGSDANNGELQVVNVSVPAAPVQVATLNLSSNGNALSVVGAGNVVALGHANGPISIINVTTPTAPTLYTTFDAGSNINDMALGNSDTYLFVASNYNEAEFQVLDITSPAATFLTGSLDVTSDLNGLAYSATHDMVYALSGENARELYVVEPYFP